MTVSPRGRIALTVLIAILYAVCYSVIKAGLAFAPPLRYAGLRVLVAGVALLGFAAVRGKPLRVERRLWPAVAGIAVLSTTIGFGAMFLSPGRTGAGIASVLGNTGPLMVVGLAAALLGERLTRGKMVALLLGFSGVSLIAYPGLAGPDAYGFVGLLLPLVAAAGSAAESIIVKRADIRDAVLGVAAWQLMIGSVPLLALSALFEGEQSVVWSPTFVGLLFYLALAGTALPTVLWYWLVQRDEVGRLSLMLFLAPVLGLLFAAALFGERIGVLEAAGVALAVSGTIVVAWESLQAPSIRREAIGP
jgi:O-acetylserine/cysteine efflux transporter